MPVILEPGSKTMRTWLDPKRKTWSKELQAILKPFEGELECYPVTKEVGKVGNNSPDFIIPVNSKENKSNIANFFSNAQKSENKLTTTTSVSPKRDLKREHNSDNDGINKKQKTEQSTVLPSSPKWKMRSATQNMPTKKSGKKLTDGSQRITNFFK